MKKNTFALLYALTFLTGFYLGFHGWLHELELTLMLIGCIIALMLILIFKIGGWLYEDLFGPGRSL